jgi:Ca-activated chloride channel family protein
MSLSNQRTIMLVIDVSLSMASTDIPPNRFAAAQAAAKAFVEGQPSDVRIGIVSFAGVANVIQVPTRNRHELTEAIDSLRLDHETAIGSGLMAALAALFPDVRMDGSDPMLDIATSRKPYQAARTRHPRDPESFPKPVTAGSNPSAAIVLMSDGASNTGIDPRAAARLAANRAVRCFTVGFGSNEEGGGDDEGWLSAGFDEDTLRAIAEITGAAYFKAASAEGLQNVYRNLSAQIVSEKNKTQITALFTAAAAVLSLLSAGLSLAWFNRPS